MKGYSCLGRLIIVDSIYIENKTIHDLNLFMISEGLAKYLYLVEWKTILEEISEFLLKYDYAFRQLVYQNIYF